MEIANLIRQRRTIHNYSNAAVDEKIVREALALALWAPNHKLTHPWRFTWIGSRCREQIADLSIQLKEKDVGGSLNEAMKVSIKEKFIHPAALIAVGMPVVQDETRKREDYASIAAGLQNSALYLWSRGVGSKWSTGKITKHSQVYKCLGISSEHEEIVGFFWIGHPDKIPPAPPRPNLESVLRFSE